VSPFVPADDDADEGADEGASKPLPADDRLWRHPSEMGAAPDGVHERIVLVEAKGPSPLRTTAIATGAGLVGAAVAIVAVLAFGGFERTNTERKVVQQVDTALPREPGQDELAIAEKVLPVVGRVESSGPGGSRTGTAVVFRTDGTLITTADVVDGATTVDVVFDDGSKLPAEPLGRDLDADIAVIKVERTFDAGAVGKSPQGLKFGSPTVVIDAAASANRAPLIAVGFVSSTSRQLDRETGGPLYGLIQTNTPAKDGDRSSGAVLVDPSGAVVGLITGRDRTITPVSSTSSPNATSVVASEGLAPQFAIPADYAWRLAADLVDKGHASHPLLGVREGTTVSGDDAIRLDVSGGLRVIDLSDDSPAARAGLRTDDVILALDGIPVTSFNDLVVAVRNHSPGDYVSIKYQRDGEVAVATAALDEKDPGLP
jgi:putative serine protease PepD